MAIVAAIDPSAIDLGARMTSTRHRAMPWLLTSVALIGVLAIACTGQQSSPSPSPSAAAVGPTARPTGTTLPMRSGPLPSNVGCDDIMANQTGPYPDPTLAPLPHVALKGDADVEATIRRATDGIGTLQSYQFSLDIIGRDLQTLQATTFDFAVRATVQQAPDLRLDGILGSRLREGNGSGAVSSGGIPIKVGNGFVWQSDNVSDVLEPSSDASTVQGMTLLTPQGAAARFILPFAGGYRRVGPERHAGIATSHYEASTKGLAAYKSTLAFKGPITADVWIAREGGYLVASRLSGKASHIDPYLNHTVDDSFVLQFELSHVNDAANVVTLPASPVPDPVRPTVPPVDLQLTYRVQPKDGKQPTSAEMDQIGVSLRQRLDISSRPIKVDTVGVDQVIVTICGTTRPDADRQMIDSSGALTIVALPKDRFGTASAPGPEPLPEIGTKIDPALTVVTPSGRAGLTRAHVDPVTGQRGLAIALSNPATDAFLPYAAAHHGEFVAVVLDDTVLATLPIDERTAKGHFVFTGDYTEAESRLLAQSLYAEPIPYELRPIEDVEIPAAR